MGFNLMKILELFAGIGACSKALTNLGIEHEIVDAVEIDKYAIKSFNAIHGTNFEPQDITKWNKDIKVDLIMHGSPCQDFSAAGKNAGGDEGSGTRSSLLYETLRIVEKTSPDIVIWENVKNLLSKKHRHNWEAYVNRMSDLGYDSTAKIMNAKNYGIPQNRERVFTVSIKKPSQLIDQFIWPEPRPLETKLKDVLEDNPDERYFLTDEQVASLRASTAKQQAKGNGFKFEPLKGEKAMAHTIATKAGSKTDNFVKIRTANKTGFDMATDGDGIDLAYPQSATRRGRVGHGVAKTIPTSDSQGTLDGYRIRKLTPRECWRLMGFSDEDFDKAQAVGTSNTQLYKQAGNSIVVNCLMEIFKGIKWRQ